MALVAARTRVRRAGASSGVAPLLDRTFEALIFDWEGAAVPDGRADTSLVRSRVEALCAAGVHVRVVSARNVVDDLDAQLRARPAGPGTLHLCLNGGSEVFEVTNHGVARLLPTADVVPSTSEWLARRGITGRLVLIVGDKFGPVGGAARRASSLVGPGLVRAVVVSVGIEPAGSPEGVIHVGGGPARFLELLDVQLARRRDRRVPSIDDDPAWVVPLPDDAAAERVAESIGTVGNGWVGSRASREEGGSGAAPLFLVNGVYTDDTVPRLLEGPGWTALGVRAGGLGGRVLDLRTGVLARHDPTTLRSVRFVSGARPDAMALRAEAPPARLEQVDPFTGEDPKSLEREERGEVRMARTTTPAGYGIVVAARDHHQKNRRRRTIERLAVWSVQPSGPAGWDEAADRLAEVEGVGFDFLLTEHREAWARRWADAEVTIDGDPDDQLAARFAVFHLLNAAPDVGEAAVGPRGLTGHGYAGHVFWDADVYMLPALAAIRPGAARAMIEYRVRRLPAARAAAAEIGRAGARFPWESAGDGRDVTPPHIRGRLGELLPVRAGDQEEHIVADVAWAAHEYTAWTGDRELLAGPGSELLTDTARYWAARIDCDRGGRGHLSGVMGPDEYHEGVDDNAYTNVMARWNLRRAAEVIEEYGGDLAEAARWRELADRIVSGWDPVRRLYEQFAGYWDLEPLIAEQIAPRPFAADMFLDAQRLAGSQLLKQPDVLMLHHLVPEEVERGSLRTNLAFYEPRTTHGSSLSPAIHAALFARSGQPDRALELFRLAARLDLDDVTGTTAAGLHLATMGGLWQALAYGFLGLRPRGDTLDVDPCLPAAWQALGLRLQFRGGSIGVRADHGSVHVSCDAPVSVRIAKGVPQMCEPPGVTFALAQADAGHHEKGGDL